MPEDHEQIVVRRKKLQELRERGIDPYPNDFRPDHTTAEVHARLSALGEAELARAAPLSIAGRVMALRDFGKAGFLQVQDRAGRLQVHARRDRLGDQGFQVYRLLDLGDVIGVAGRPFRTRTGELTLEAAELRLLAKALHPLPEKWHGLQDVETRYRQRYLDLIVNPDARRIFEVRARAVRYLRDFLVARGYLEVETPMMQPIAGGAAARPFVTHHNALDVDLYLRIAPELYLKRLVVGGYERVFELSRVFRNEGVSTRHNPEFTMLEFYQAHTTYEDLMALTEEMLVGLAHEVAGGTTLAYGGETIDLARPWPRRTMAELVSEHASVPAERVLDRELLGRLAASHGITTHPSASAGHLRAARRHRPPGHAAHRCDLDPRGDPLPASPVGDRDVSWALFVGLRYLRARRRTFLSLISLISLLGVTIGVATLDIVLAVMTGFEQDLRDKILGMNPHIVVVSYGGPLAGDPPLGARPARARGGAA